MANRKRRIRIGDPARCMKIKVWVGKRRVRVRDTAIKINNTRRQTYRSGLFRSTASAELEEFPWLAYKLTRGRQTTLAYPLFPGFWSSFRAVVRAENFEHTHIYIYINIQVYSDSRCSLCSQGNNPKNGCPVCEKHCPQRLTKQDEYLCWNQQHCQRSNSFSLFLSL